MVLDDFRVIVFDFFFCEDSTALAATGSEESVATAGGAAGTSPTDGVAIVSGV